MSNQLTHNNTNLSVWVGTFDNKHVWINPVIIHKTGDSDNHANEKDAWLCPAWFVEQTDNEDLINCEIVWAKKGRVQVPMVQNIKKVEPETRLYRAKKEGGTCPEDVRKMIMKEAKKKKQQEEAEKQKEGGSHGQEPKKKVRKVA